MSSPRSITSQRGDFRYKCLFLGLFTTIPTIAVAWAAQFSMSWDRPLPGSLTLRSSDASSNLESTQKKLVPREVFTLLLESNSNNLKYLGVTCGPNGEGKEIAVGFDYSESNFAPLYKVCFDEARANAIYAVNTIPKETANRDTSNDRPSWK